MRRTLVAALVVAGLTFAGPAGAQDREPRIVGGGGTTIEEWPWQVGIADAPDGVQDGFDRQFCGGTLVAPRIVVSAAHCFFEDPATEFADDAGDFSAITGTTNLSQAAPPREIVFEELYFFVADGADAGTVPDVEAASATPLIDGEILYDDTTSEWDVVFLKLPSPAPAPAAPVLIAGADEAATWAAGRTAWVTGWGNRSSTGSSDFPDDLHEVQITMIADSTCGSSTVYGGEFIPQTMVCAGELAGGKDTCQGDSGGPLVVPLAGGGFRLVGDTSWGDGCAQPNKPGVYGRIAADPMRTALEQGIAAALPGTDVTGSGGQPPVTTPPTTPPVATNPPTGSDDSACERAKSKLKRAKRKLKNLKQNDARAKRIDRARDNVKRKKQKVKQACG